AEQRNRRLWLEAVLIFAAWTVFGLLLANQSYIQTELRGRQMPWLVALRPGLLEAILWAFTMIAIFLLARRFPLEPGRVLRGIAVHLVGAVVISLARTGVMVVLGRYVKWVGVRIFRNQFWETSSLNFLFYALLVGIARLVLYYQIAQSALWAHPAITGSSI